MFLVLTVTALASASILVQEDFLALECVHVEVDVAGQVAGEEVDLFARYDAAVVGHRHVVDVVDHAGGVELVEDVYEAGGARMQHLGVLGQAVFGRVEVRSLQRVLVVVGALRKYQNLEKIFNY